MTPTQEQIEALVKRLREPYEQNQSRRVAEEFDAADALEALSQARAALAGVKALPRSDGDGGWTLPMELLQDLEREVMADGWDGCTAEVTEIIALSVERRILTALSPAPGWREGYAAGLEAALQQIRKGSDNARKRMRTCADEGHPEGAQTWSAIVSHLDIAHDDIRAITIPEKPHE